MYDVYINKFKSGNSIVTDWTRIMQIPASNVDGFPMSNPTVKSSEDNADSFDFSMEMNSPYYDSLLELKTLVIVNYDGDAIFFGRVLTVDNSSVYQTRRVHCEGAYGFMNDTYYEGLTENNKQKIDWSTYYSRIISNHNAMIQERSPEKGILRGTVTIDGSTAFTPTTEQRKYEPSSWTQTGSLINSLVSEFGGHTRVNYRNAGNYLDWYKYYARDLGANRPTVSVGENIIDISLSSNNIDKLFTWVTPMGDTGKNGKPVYLDGFTYTDKNGTSHTISGKHIPVSIVRDVYTDAQLNDDFHSASEYSSAQDNYGTIYKPMTFASAKTQQQLWDYTIAWIKNCYFGIAPSFTIRAYDMHILDDSRPKILIGDCVNVQYVIMENGARTVKTKRLVCKAVSYDLFNPDNNSYTFGIPSEILNRTYSEGRGKSASEQTGGGGGGGGGGGDDGPVDYTFRGVYYRIQAAAGQSTTYGGNAAADSFWANGEMSGTARVYDPSEIPEGETITQNQDLIFNAEIIGRIGTNIYVAMNSKRGLFAFIGGRSASGALPITFWYQQMSNKQTCTYSPPSATMTEEAKQVIEVAKDWGIELRDEDEAKAFSKTLLISVDDTVKGFVAKVKNKTTGTVFEPLVATFETVNNFIKSNFKVSGNDSKIEVSTGSTTAGSTGIEMNSDGNLFGWLFDNNEEKESTYELDAQAGKVSSGKDQNGNWKSVMNETITWTDEHGVEHTTDGFVKAMDFSVREIPSFKTKFVAVDQLIADKATIGELNSQIARIDSIESNYITVNNFNAKLGRVNGLTVGGLTLNTLTANGGIYCSSLSIGQPYNQNIKDIFLDNIRLAGPNAQGQYTLYKSINGVEEPIGTFNRAGGSSIASWGWSNGIFSVKDAENTVLVSTELKALMPEGDITVVNDKIVKRNVRVFHGVDEDHIYATGFTDEVAIDATDVFNNGKNEGYNSAGIVADFTNHQVKRSVGGVAQATIVSRTDPMSWDSANKTFYTHGYSYFGDNPSALAMSDKRETGALSLAFGSWSGSGSLRKRSVSLKEGQSTLSGLSLEVPDYGNGYDAGQASVGLKIIKGNSTIIPDLSSNAIQEALIALNGGSLNKTTGERTVSCTVNSSEFLKTVITDYNTGKTDAFNASGLEIDTTNKQVKRVASSNTKTVSITAVASITYDSSTHKYTAGAQSKAGTANMQYQSKESGLEAYYDGYDANASAWLYEQNTGNSAGNLNPGIWVTAGYRDHNNGVHYCGTKWRTLEVGGVREHTGAEPSGLTPLAANKVFEVYYNNGSGGTPGSGKYFKTPAGEAHTHSVTMTRYRAGAVEGSYAGQLYRRNSNGTYQALGSSTSMWYACGTNLGSSATLYY